MNRTHFGVQVAIVLTMVAFVSWPQFRPVRAQTVWRYTRAVVQQAETEDALRYSYGEENREGVGFGRASYTTVKPPSQISTFRTTGNEDQQMGQSTVRLDPLTALGAKVNALIGLAHTSLNTPIPYARVLLRDIKTGQIEARATANDKGRFSFLDVGASSYIVELIGSDGSVVAASELVAMNRGDIRETDIRIAATETTVRTSFGSTLSATLPQTAAAAAGSDVTRTTATLTPQESSR